MLVKSRRMKLEGCVRVLMSSTEPGASVYVPKVFTSGVVYESGYMACQMAKSRST